MKFILLLLAVVLTPLVSQSQEINWMTMNEALEAQKKNPKKIFVDFYTTWCGPCKLLDRNTFTNKDVIDYLNTHYYSVKFNAEGNEIVNYNGKTFTNPGYQPNRTGRNATHQFTSALRISGYPTLAYFDEKGNFIQGVPGYRTPQQLEIFLKMMANNDYKKLTTTEAWHEYERNFKHTFN